MSNGTDTNGGSIIPVINRMRRGAYAVAGVGVLGSIVAGLVSTQQFFQAFLFAYMFWLCFSLGCFALTLLHHMIRGSWALPILRILEAGTKTLPLMAGLFLVIVAGVLMGQLYPWTFSETELARVPQMTHGVHSKSAYLNVSGFLIRAAIYFAIWIGLSAFLNRSSLLQDKNRDESLAQQRTNVSAPGFVVFVLTLTVAMTDWVMSLDPRWYSTLFGLWFLVIQGLSALALSVFLVVGFSNRRPFSDIVTPQLTRDLGNLLLTGTMLWAYLSLTQFLIMWSANLPEEVTYYTTRTSGGWLPVGTALILLQFLAPFLMLLSGRTKRTPAYLSKVALLILVMRLVDMTWTIVPFYQQAGQPVSPHLAWMCVAALLGVGGLWLGWFANALRRNPLLPRHDPRLQEVTLEHA